MGRHRRLREVESPHEFAGGQLAGLVEQPQDAQTGGVAQAPEVLRQQLGSTRRAVERERGSCDHQRKLNANGQPTTGTPAIVRFTGVTGHFSDWAVAIVEAKGSGSAAPDNEFSFGKVKKNKRRGTAKLTVNVPGPGGLELTQGKKVKGDEAQAEAAGEVQLLVKPKGKAKRKLNQLGKAKLSAEVTYTPDGGTPNTQSKNIKLVRK